MTTSTEIGRWEGLCILAACHSQAPKPTGFVKCHWRADVACRRAWQWRSRRRVKSRIRVANRTVVRERWSCALDPIPQSTQAADDGCNCWGPVRCWWACRGREGFAPTGREASHSRFRAASSLSDWSSCRSPNLRRSGRLASVAKGPHVRRTSGPILAV